MKATKQINEMRHFEAISKDKKYQDVVNNEFSCILFRSADDAHKWLFKNGFNLNEIEIVESEV